MSESEGRLQTLTTDAVAIGSMQSAAFSADVAMLDSTTHDDGSRTFLPGRESSTVSVSGLFDDADAGQEQLKVDLFARTSSVYVMLMQTATGLDRYTFTAYVSNIAIDGPNDDLSTITAELQVTGAVTRDTQP